MEILGCGASRAGWSVMLSWYMEWNFWPQFDQKRCQHMLENPTCKTGNAYQGASYSRGGILLNVSIQWKYGTIWVRGRTAKSRLGPVCGCGSWTASQTRQKNKLNSLSNGIKRSYREVDDWWEKHKTLCLFKKSLLEKLWTQRILAGLNMCDWTWQHVPREKVRLTRVTQPHSHHQRSFIIFQTSGAILAWNMNSLGIWVRFC